MSAANLNLIEKSMVLVLVVVNTGGGLPLLYGIISTIEGKPTQRKKKNNEVDKKWAKEMHNKTPITKNSR
jgi:hypothetical protein